MHNRGTALIRRRGVGTRLAPAGADVTIKMSGVDTEGAFALFECTLRPGDVSPPAHRHPFSELFYVLEGTLGVDIDGRRYKAAAGAAVYVSGGATHTVATGAGSTVRFLVLAVPAGIENYLIELEHELADLSPRQLERGVTRDRMARLLLKHGIETVAPS